MLIVQTFRCHYPKISFDGISIIRANLHGLKRKWFCAGQKVANIRKSL